MNTVPAIERLREILSEYMRLDVGNNDRCSLRNRGSTIP